MKAWSMVAPRESGGRGLKPARLGEVTGRLRVAPRESGGRGLKLVT